jgi:prepilin-type N-terminal cleavage/methylation domain-containing protein/prepilin-type processing-associated H-X9-DG protein
MTTHAPRPRGFTLVELLVVLGIIVVLLGLLLPTLRNVRASSHAIKCAANLRSIGALTTQYIASWRARLPVNSFAMHDDPAALLPSLPPGTAGTVKALLTGEGSTSNLQWHDAVARLAGWPGASTIAGRYALGEEEQFRDATQYLWCPDVDQSGRDPAVFATSYGMPRKVALAFQVKVRPTPPGALMNDFNAISHFHYGRVRHASQIVFLTEYNFRDDSSGPYNGCGHSLGNVDQLNGVTIRPAIRHGGVNYLFFDGHVDRLRAPPHVMHTLDPGGYRTSDGDRYTISSGQVTQFLNLLGPG